MYINNKINIFLLASLLVVLFFSGCIQKPSKTIDISNNINLSESEIKRELLKEFNDSYVKEADPNGETVEFNLEAKEEVTLPNGKKDTLFAYNGQVPGPTFKIKLGQTIKINFKNSLLQDTTVHFHGVRVPNAMDGVPGVTQDPVKPGEDFVYEFTPKDAGTFWFHPHVRTSEQIEKGLYGVLIVEDFRPDPYTQDVILVVDDWRINKVGNLDKNFNTGHDLMHDGRWGQYITVNGNLSESLSVKKVKG